MPKSTSPAPTADPHDPIRAVPRQGDDPRRRELAEAIVDAVVEAIVVFDPTDRVIATVNRAACELMGRPAEDLIGHPIDEFLRPSDAARLRRLIGPLMSGEREVATVLAEYQAPGDRSTSVEVVLQRVQLPDGVKGVVAIARDVGERIEVQVRLQRLAQAEHARAAELNAVIRALGEAVVVCQADGTISLTNPAAEDLFEGVEPRTFADILAQLDDPAGDAPELGSQGGPIELPTRADPERWLEIATYPVNLGLGLATSDGETIVVLRDVTEARRREVVRETFIGVLSHELRTPVTTIFGGPSCWPARARRSTRRRGGASSATSTTRPSGSSAWSRTSSPSTGSARVPGEIGWEPVLLQRLVPRVVQSEEGRWPGVTFVPEVANTLPTVTADPTYVEQVIRNLLSNAAKYGGAGSTVAIRVEAGDDEVLVRVLDDGRASRPTRRAGCSSCSTARRGPRRRPAARASACSCAPA